jgi:hypothetical protein
LVSQYGNNQPEPISLQTFADAGRIDGFTIHSGDIVGTLKGNRLDEVVSLTFKGATFVPGELTSKHGIDELPMVARDPPSVAAFKPERSVAAKVTLRDGRVFPLFGTVDAPRPSVSLLGMVVQPSPSSRDSNIQLDPSELPQDATLTFSLRTQYPAAFDRDETIEVATSDESSMATLSFSNGGAILENSQVAVATLNPAKVFGGAAFGPLQFRVNSKGTVGDWQPLANLVRLPNLKDLGCPTTPELACKLSGTNLFLIDSVSNDPKFAHSVKVPDGFLGSALPVPHPTSGSLYVKLRDDPSIVNAASLSMQEIPASADAAARADTRNSARPGAPEGSAPQLP